MQTLTTVDFVPWDTLGPAATPYDLHAFRKAVETVVKADAAVEAFDLTILDDSEGEPSLLRVTVTGTTRADVLVERAWNNGKFD
jgi:hypothetical protein